MSELCFYPGIARKELELQAREHGMPMAVVLRGLIDRAPLVANNDMIKAYEKITHVGRAIVAYAHARDLKTILTLAHRALAIAKTLEKAPGSGRASSQAIAEIRASREGKAMRFRPMEQEEKLIALATQASLSKTAVLRALILGIQLPDHQAQRSFARISQVSGLCRHCAYSWQDRPGWRRLLTVGIALGDLARVGLVDQQDRRDTTQGLEK